MRWLFEAKKRFSASILNYMITSNHIHLIIKDGKEEGTIPQTIQLTAGRMGQEYNQRKKRKGAYWEDRYHATAVETDSHLSQCMVYVDMNMVRAGVVKHPGEWPFCGYTEIQNPRQRYSIIDYESLLELFGCRSIDEFKALHRGWVEEAIEKRSRNGREPRWTESIAVGTEAFVTDTKEILGIKGKGREIVNGNGCYELRESLSPYNAVFGGKNEGLRPKNEYFWSDYA
jgi:REP element-mobilizing transposase RayT